MEKEFVIFKEPVFENDSAYLRINSKTVEFMRESIIEDGYYVLKDLRFSEKDVNSSGFEIFSEGRPSLRNMPRYLEGSIYTFSCEKKNGKSYENILDTVADMLKKNSRRAFVTMSDRLIDYENSLQNREVDVSCLSSIHYKEDCVSLFFRASDVKNELKVDIITVYDYFLKKVYSGADIIIDLFISTCQNINGLIKLKEEFYENC